MLLGVDVSHHQDPDSIDWPRLAQAGVRFAYARATYGVSPDETFQRHLRNAQAAGLLTGAYHFLRFKPSQSAEAQAEAFLEALEPLAPHGTSLLPPMLDLEANTFDTPIKTAANRRDYVTLAHAWLKMVEQRLGRLSGIYTVASFFDGELGSPPGFGTRPLWVAHYTTKPAPRLPQPWSRYTFWQFSDSGQLPGFAKALDLNRFDGTVAELQALADVHAFSDNPAPLEGTEPREAPLGAAVPGSTDSLAVMRVASKGLSFRSAPVDTAQTFMLSLPLGHRVEILQKNVPALSGSIVWAKVRTFINGTPETGYMAQSHLRPLERDSVERLVDAAVNEWKRFKMGSGKETVSPFSGFVGEMWRDLDPNSKITGNDTGMFWSAAAISWFVHHAGDAYKGFKRSSLHSTYIHDAIVKRESGKEAPFWGYRLNEKPVAVGDIVCIDRTDAGIDYDFAKKHATFSSHTDVIVSIFNGTAISIGGNVSNSVSTKEWSLTSDGKLVPGSRLFALMKNMTH